MEDIRVLVDNLPQIDGFVCNAGVSKQHPIQSFEEETLRELLEINTVACFTLTKAIISAGKMNRDGSMVFISSMAARLMQPGNSMYAASKAALEFAPMGIRSNAILPGLVETPLVKNAPVPEEVIERKRKQKGSGTRPSRMTLLRKEEVLLKP